MSGHFLPCWKFTFHSRIKFFIWTYIKLVLTNKTIVTFVANKCWKNKAFIIIWQGKVINYKIRILSWVVVLKSCYHRNQGNIYNYLSECNWWRVIGQYISVIYSLLFTKATLPNAYIKPGTHHISGDFAGVTVVIS